MPPIDLRSDTVTRPSAAMRQAMAQAQVDDDVLGRDPTVARVEEKTAELLGKEAALFVPSGSMSNQIAVRLHCGPGSEFFCEEECHIYNYEQGGFAQLSGVVARTFPGEFGVLRLEQFQDQIRIDDEHLVRTRMVTLENTHNHGGGVVLPAAETRRICDWAHAAGLTTHLDGARLMNAAVASGTSAAELAAPFDTVSMCFSKGLGAPVGSALAGPADWIREARRHRKLFGGGMRQSGIIAAGALYALEHNIERLAEDHQHAHLLARAIDQIDGLSLHSAEVHTNIVIFKVDPGLGTAEAFHQALQDRGVLTIPFGGPLIRAVTHLDVSRQQIERAAEILAEVAAERISQ